MTEARTYPAGVTCWIDTGQPDVDAACHFYGELFGWSFTDALPPDAPAIYRIATVDGADVAAIASSDTVDAAVTWRTYVAVDDADDAATAVTAGGGTVLTEPADAGPGGRSATCADPQGATFRLWQARRRLGAQLTNAPGTWNFSDLTTPDIDAALAFYAPLFGWRSAPVPGVTGRMLQVAGYGDHLAGTVDPDIHERQAGAPEGFADVIGSIRTGRPAQWHVTFTVADRDESVALAERLGATTVDTAEGLWQRSARLRDPQGAELTVSQFTPPVDSGQW